MKIKYLTLIAVFLSFAAQLTAQQPWEITADAVTKYQAGKIDEAVNLLRLAISADPEFADAKLILGQIFLEEGRFEQAKNILIECERLTQNNADVYFYLGAAYLNLNEFENALAQFQKVKKLNPAYENLPELLSICFMNLGVADYQKNKKRSAIKKFRKAVEADYQNIQAYKNLAVTLYEFNEREEAKIIILKALKINPKEKTLLKILMQIYADKNKPEEAQKTAEKYYKYYPNDIDGALQLAYLYRFNNEGDKAIPIYEKAIRNSPDDLRVYDDYSELFRYRGKFDKAVSIYERALERFPNNAEIFIKIAAIYREAEKYEEARREYRKALSAKGGNESVYLKIAETFLIENKKARAIDVLNEGINNSRNNWNLYRKLGAVWEDSSKSKAIDVYVKMNGLRPNDAFPLIRLCAVYNEIDSTKLACETCAKAIDMKTDDPLPYHIYAELKLAERDTLTFLKNEILSAEKSLKIISKYQTKYLTRLKNSGGRFTEENIERIKSDNKTVEFTRGLLKESMDSLFAVSGPDNLIIQIEKWRKDYPANTLLVEYLGKSYERLNKSDKAFSIYKELVKLDPEEIEGHLGMARILESEGKLNDAFLAYKRALTIDSENEKIYKKLFYLSRATENLSKLIDDWLLLEKREPENLVLLGYLAQALEIEGRKKELKRVEEKIEEINSGLQNENESNIQIIRE